MATEAHVAKKARVEEPPPANEGHAAKNPGVDEPPPVSSADDELVGVNIILPDDKIFPIKIHPSLVGVIGPLLDRGRLRGRPTRSHGRPACGRGLLLGL